MVDLSFLEKFTKGNTTKMKRYISMYIDVAPETFERMKQNIKDQSWNELAINAHSLKPQADYMGIIALKEVLVEIENDVKKEAYSNLKNLYQRAYQLHQESEAILKAHIEGL